jgi:hypothetical protein
MDTGRIVKIFDFFFISDLLVQDAGVETRFLEFVLPIQLSPAPVIVPTLEKESLHEKATYIRDCESAKIQCGFGSSFSLECGSGYNFSL